MLAPGPTPGECSGPGQAPPFAMLPPMRARAVSLDLFDTLVDLHMEALPEFRLGERVLRGTAGLLHEVAGAPLSASLETFVRELSAVDRELRKTHYAQQRELPTDTRFTALLERFDRRDPDLVAELTRTHMDALVERVRILPHHVEALAALRDRGLRVAVCSNFSHTGTAERVLAEAGLTPHLDSIVISETVGLRKPHSRIFEATLEALGTDPGETLHVGDNLEADVGGAAALGMPSVWITRRVSDPAAALGGFEGPRPQHVIADLDELPGLVDAS